MRWVSCRINRAGSEGAIDLVTELATTIVDALRRVEFWDKNLQALFSKMPGDAREVFESEFLAEAEDAVDQNDIHGSGS